MVKLHAHMKEKHGYSSLKQHLLNTTRNHLCQICGRVFPFASHLNIHHNRVHPDLPPDAAKCKICGKTFSNLEKIKKHMHVHSDERKYVCTTCGKRYKTAGNLHQHKQQHLARKHVCGCGDAFTYRHGLVNHQARCFAGLPCKRPHSKNRPQKDSAGNLIPPSFDCASNQSRVSDQVPPPEPSEAQQLNSGYVVPAYLPPPPNMPPLVLPPQVFPAETHFNSSYSLPFR